MAFQGTSGVEYLKHQMRVDSSEDKAGNALADQRDELCRRWTKTMSKPFRQTSEEFKNQRQTNRTVSLRSLAF